MDEKVNIPGMHRCGRRSVRLILILFLIAFAVAVVTSFWLSARLVAPAPRAIGPPPNDLPVEVVTIPSESGSTLAGWYAPGRGGIGTIVLLHAIRSSRLSMLGRARLFWRAGYSVLLVDLQAHGESPGQYITAGYLESSDARAAVLYARQRSHGDRVGVVGVSLGGAAALLASPLDVDAMTLESVYPTIREAVDNRVRMRLGPLSPIATSLLLMQLRPRLGISPSQLRPIDHIGKVGCPVLVMAGNRDQHTTLAESRRLFEQASAPKQLVVFDGARHEDLLRFSPETYAANVLPFMSEHLRP